MEACATVPRSWGGGAYDPPLSLLLKSQSSPYVGLKLYPPPQQAQVDSITVTGKQTDSRVVKSGHSTVVHPFTGSRTVIFIPVYFPRSFPPHWQLVLQRCYGHQQVWVTRVFYEVWELHEDVRYPNFPWSWQRGFVRSHADGNLLLLWRQNTPIDEISRCVQRNLFHKPPKEKHYKKNMQFRQPYIDDLYTSLNFAPKQ